MNSDQHKSQEKLLQEVADLKNRLEAMEKQSQENEKKLADLDKTAEMLKMANLIIDRSPVILFRRLAGEIDHSLVYVSRNISQFGYTADELLDGTVEFKDLVHPDDFEWFFQEVVDFAEQDLEEYTQHYRIVTKSGETRWVEDQTSVVWDENGVKTHGQGVIVDITERKLAQDLVHRSEEKYRRIVETAGEGFFLLDEEFNIVETNESFCRMLGYTRSEILGRLHLELMTEEFCQFLVTNRERLLEKEYRRFEGDFVRKDGTTVPVLVHGNTLRDDQGNVIGNMAFVADMTEQKKALALAGEVQKSLLPQENPKIPGLDIAGRNISCDEVGGDYYDFFWQPGAAGKSYSIAVGDITGHGVDAALLMTSARAFLRAHASNDNPITEIVGSMNYLLADDVQETGRFMTLFYLSISSDLDGMEWIRAGHDPALLYDPESDTFEELTGPGVALGLIPTYAYQPQRMSGLKDGQLIAIGTDGIWEARNREGEMYGRERFKEVLKKHSKGSANDILNAVFSDLERFCIGLRSEDDITLVIVKIQKEKI